jgi:ribosomal protein L7/L12
MTAEDAGFREAERLRIILQSFADVQPNMMLHEAVPAIFETEKKTRDLESVQAVAAVPGFPLPDPDNDTVSKWIDLNPDVQTLILDGKKLQAIKEVRTRTMWKGAMLGLYESKEGVEYWDRTRGSKVPAPAVSSSTRGTGKHDIADWIAEVGQYDIRDLGFDSKRIQAIKEVRHRYPEGAGLKEAKDGYEEWERRAGISHSAY